MSPTSLCALPADWSEGGLSKGTLGSSVRFCFLGMWTGEESMMLQKHWEGFSGLVSGAFSTAGAAVFLLGCSSLLSSWSSVRFASPFPRLPFTWSPFSHGVEFTCTGLVTVFWDISPSASTSIDSTRKTSTSSLSESTSSAGSFPGCSAPAGLTKGCSVAVAGGIFCWVGAEGGVAAHSKKKKKE